MHSYLRILHLPHQKSNKLSLLYTVSTLRTFAFLLISLFLPIFIMRIFVNEGLDERKSIIMTAIVFLLLHLFQGLFLPLVSKIIAKFGTKYGFIIGQTLLSISLYLIFFSINSGTLFLGFIFWGISTSFYWVSYHLYFLESGKSKYFGEEIGLLEMIAVLTGMIAPGLSGFVVTFYGSTTLFIICEAIMITTIFLLIKVRDKEKFRNVNIADIIYEIKTKRRDLVSFVGLGGEEVIYTIVWPILLFFVYKSFLNVGIFASLVVITSGIVAVIVGQLSDSRKRSSLQKVGSITIFLTFLGRVIFRTPLSLFITDSLHKLFYNFLFLPMETISYKHALSGEKLKYIIFREFGFRVGNVLGSLSIIFTIIIGLPFFWVFIIAAFLSLLPMLARDEESEKILKV